jgi:hypothetical protein
MAVSGPCFYGLALLGHTSLETTEVWWFETGFPLCLVAHARNTVNDDDVGMLRTQIL